MTSFSFTPPPFAPPQRDREELLDLGRGTLNEVRRSLHDIRRINTHLGGARVVCDATWNLLSQHHKKHIRVLDIGTGSADIPLRLLRESRKRGLEMQIVALDLNAHHLRIAREDLNATNAIATNAIQLVQADAFQLPFGDEAFDVVVSSLFLHHFREAQIVSLLCEFDRVSRCGWAMNDLVRHHVPLMFFRLTRPIFARSYITRHDGEASLRRGYTTTEMQAIIARAAQNEPLFRDVRISQHFPFRMSLVREKIV